MNKTQTMRNELKAIVAQLDMVKFLNRDGETLHYSGKYAQDFMVECWGFSCGASGKSAFNFNVEVNRLGDERDIRIMASTEAMMRYLVRFLMAHGFSIEAVTKTAQDKIEIEHESYVLKEVYLNNTEEIFSVIFINNLNNSSFTNIYAENEIEFRGILDNLNRFIDETETTLEDYTEGHFYISITDNEIRFSDDLEGGERMKYFGNKVYERELEALLRNSLNTF